MESIVEKHVTNIPLRCSLAPLLRRRGWRCTSPAERPPPSAPLPSPFLAAIGEACRVPVRAFLRAMAGLFRLAVSSPRRWSDALRPSQPWWRRWRKAHIRRSLGRIRLSPCRIYDERVWFYGGQRRLRRSTAMTGGGHGARAA
jgi:hypothetical protein